jgi:AraC-like DNA-binding protein/mannose-6-phosphate isomerase-like protein (cupin superfamily)
MLYSTGTRFTPVNTGFSLFLLDKRGGRFRSDLPQSTSEAVDEAHLPVPVWRTPQPRPHAHDDHEINLVVAGSCRYIYGSGECVTVGVGQMLAIPGGVMHTVEVDALAVVRGMWMHPTLWQRLNAAHLDANVQSLTQVARPLPPRWVQDAALWKTFNELWEQSQEVLAGSTPWRDEFLGSLGRLAALHYWRVMQMPPPLRREHATHERVLHVRAWMERHYLEPVTLQQLAQRAGLSVSQFSYVFQQLNGTSPKAFLSQRRLQQAANLLETTQLSIGEIAVMAGYRHDANFNHHFKAKFGLAPLSYRKKHQKNRENW